MTELFSDNPLLSIALLVLLFVAVVAVAYFARCGVRRTAGDSRSGWPEARLVGEPAASLAGSLRSRCMLEGAWVTLVNRDREGRPSAGRHQGRDASAAGWSRPAIPATMRRASTR